MGLDMTASRRGRFIAAAGALLAGAALLSAAAPLHAQEEGRDSRWQAWLGCWQPADAPQDAQGKAPPRLVCVVPAQGASAVDIVTVADTQVVSRERVDAGGSPVPGTRERCRGWESARWSGDARRVYLRSGYACADEQQRRSSGIMAISARGEWLDVQAVTIAGRTGVRAVRYRPADLDGAIPGEVASALEDLTAEAGMARVAASAPVGTEDVVEASRQVDPQTVQAWLTERGEGFSVNGRRLAEMADAGVPSSVIDVVVALSYPRVFAVNPASRQGEPRAEVASGGAAPVPYGYDRGGWGFRYSPYGWDSYWPYDWGYYSRYGPYGYGYGYGYGHGYGYSPYGGYYGPYVGYYGDGVVITVVGGQSRGRVVNGRGYTQNAGAGSTAVPRSPSGSQSTGSAAIPREPSSGRNSGSTGNSGSSAGASRSGGGTASSSPPPAPSGSGASSSTGRTAQPRPPHD